MKRFSDILPGIIIVSIVILSAFFFWQKQGGFLEKGNIISETRVVAGFDKVSISGNGLVVVEQGQDELLRIDADGRLLEYIITEVIDEELQISYKEHAPFSFPIPEATFYLTVKEIEKINLIGSVNLKSSLTTANQLELIINGSGRMEMEIQTENLTVNLNGSGRIELEGVADQQQVTVSDSGDFYGKKLEGKEGKVTLAGSGRVEVNTTDKLDVSIGGSGSVYYLGDPALGKIDISSSGRMEKL